MSNWHEGLADFDAACFTTLALTLDPAAPDLEEAIGRAGDRVALLLGSEGDGLSRRWQRQAHSSARIPMAHGVDSLNVAAAAAIACYALTSSSRAASSGQDTG